MTTRSWPSFARCFPDIPLPKRISGGAWTSRSNFRAKSADTSCSTTPIAAPRPPNKQPRGSSIFATSCLRLRRRRIGKYDFDDRALAGRGVDFCCAADLLPECPDETRADAGRCIGFVETYAVVFDGEAQLLVAHRFKNELDRPVAIARKRMFEGVGDRFHGEQRQCHRHVARHGTMDDVGGHAHRAVLAAEALARLLRKLFQELLHVDRVLVVDLVENAMDESECVDARARVAQRFLRCGIL